MSDSFAPMSPSRFLEAVPDKHLRRVAEAKIATLHEVLTKARTMGMAMGRLMERENLSEHEAFEELIYVSEHNRRMVGDVAADIVNTGEVPDA